MKFRTTLSGIVLIVCLFSCGEVVGQSLDSIPIIQPKKTSFIYSLNKWGIRQVEVKTVKPRSMQSLEMNVQERIREGLFTLFTGISTSSTTDESAWVYLNQLIINEDEALIACPLIVRGIYEKERNRVTDADGSSSLETSEYVDLNWNDGVFGAVITNGDTLGTYQVHLRDTPDDPDGHWKVVEERTGWLTKKLKRYGFYNHSNDFIVNGAFDRQAFTLVYSGRYFRCALIKEGECIALWQNEPDAVMLSKKHRIYPYILTPEKQSDDDGRNQMILLGLGQIIARTLMESGD